MVGIHVTMTAVTAGIYTVKKVNTTLNPLQDIGRSTNPHKIRRLVLRQMRNHLIQDPVHLLMTFTNCKAAHCIAVQIHLRDSLGMLNTDIFINSPLVNAKKKLVLVNGIRQTVQTSHLILASFKPTCCTRYRFLYIIPVCHTAWALIKGHCNGRGQI